MAWELKYASHLPVLIRLVGSTTGPVLELGTGAFSTPVLHWMCLPTGRRLVSYDDNGAYHRAAKKYRTPWHEVTQVKSWDDAPIAEPWDVALVDHAPSLRRREEIRRLAHHARFIVVHDTDWYYEKDYGFKSVFPYFRFNWEFTLIRPRTRVLSNFADPAELLRW
jgi:hypothetical protein